MSVALPSWTENTVRAKTGACLFVVLRIASANSLSPSGVGQKTQLVPALAGGCFYRVVKRCGVPGSNLHPRRESELFENVLHVLCGRRFRKDQSNSDLLIGASLGHQ